MNEKELLEQLKNDPAFIEEIRNAEDAEEMAKLFMAKGIEVTTAQIEALFQEEGEGELNEDDLDNVAGGFGTVLAGVAVILFLAGVAKGARCDTKKKK